MHPPIKTTIHAYNFDISKPADCAAYDRLCAQLAALKDRQMVSHGGDSHWKPEIDGKTVTLETESLFDNQWNTAPIDGISEKGLRVFDWAEDYPSRLSGASTHTRRGHWLEQTPAMREIRRNTHKCGFCGKMEPAQKGDVFCPHCIDSEYLKEGDLPLTRMRPVDESGLGGKVPALTEGERAHLLPIYRDAQLHGTTVRGKARLANLRDSIEAKFRDSTRNAKAERDGLIWLLDHGLKTDNVIFYSHTGRFCFGWRSPVSADIKSAILDVISEFPFPYDIKTEEGRTLSGD